MFTKTISSLSDRFFAYVDPRINPELTENLNNLELTPAPYVTYENPLPGGKTTFDYCFSQSSPRTNKIDPQLLFHDSPKNIKENFLKSLVDEEVLEVKFPLSSVQSLSASRSALPDYPSIHAFGESNYKYYRERSRIQNMTEREYFDWCLSKAIQSSDLGLFFNVKALNPIIQWSNSDGSHRFSTACYINKKEFYNHIVSAKLRVSRFDFDWLSKFNDVFEGYLLKGKNRLGGNWEDAFYSSTNQNSRSAIMNFFHQQSPAPAFIELFRYPDTNESIHLLLNHTHRKTCDLTQRWINRKISEGSFKPLPTMIRELEEIERRNYSYLQGLFL